MKFSVLLSDIKEPINSVTSIAGSSLNKDDITKNIYFEVKDNKLILKANNYNIEMQSCVSLQNVESEGVITVNANKIKDTLSNLDPSSLVDFYFNENKNTLEIKTSKVSYELRTQSAVNFPTFDRDCVVQTIKLKQKQLKSIIDSSLFCVITEDFRDYLKGIRFEFNGKNLDIYTSDGHRLTMLRTSVEQEQTVASGIFGAIIPKQGAAQLASIIKEDSETEVELTFSKNNVFTSCNGYVLASKLINCSYPDIRKAIPDNIQTEYLLPKAELTNLIRQVSVLASKRVNGVTFNFSNGRLDLRAENSEHELSCATLEDPGISDVTEIALNGSYVVDVLKIIKSEKVRLCFTNPASSVLIKPETDELEEGITGAFVISRVVV